MLLRQSLHILVDEFNQVRVSLRSQHHSCLLFILEMHIHTLRGHGRVQALAFVDTHEHSFILELELHYVKDEESGPFFLLLGGC